MKPSPVTARAERHASAAEPRPGTFRRLWLWPVVIGLASLVGLLSALVGDGVWDALSWVTLGIPVVIAVVAWRRAGVRRG